jgi:threonine dehydrogenase-like Zn-dependent dehydrogenase
MPMPARAALLVEPRHYEMREFPIPEPEPGAVLVRNELSGICGTDKHTYEGYVGQYTGSAKPSSTPFPIIQGHENVGTVAAMGGRVLDFDGVELAVGDRVVVSPNLVCGTCFSCTHDLPYTLCENIRDYGNTISAAEPPHLFGGWSHYLYALPGSRIFRVPDGLPSEVAVLAEVMAVTVGLDRAKQIGAFPSEGFQMDDTVVVFGTGPLGLCHVAKARMLGAGAIIAVDLSASRLEFARRLGADHAVDRSSVMAADLLAFVRDLTHGRGADVVVECAGVPIAVPESLDLLRPGGTYIEAGNFSDLGTVEISPNRHLCSKGIRMIGIAGNEAGAYGPSMRQMARTLDRYPWREFVSHRFPLERVEEAVTTAIAPSSLKVVIEPWLEPLPAS